MAQFSLEQITARRAEYEAATAAWNATWEKVSNAQAQHLIDGVWAPVEEALAAHAPNVARFDAAFNAMAELPEDEEIEAAMAAQAANIAQPSLEF